MCLSLHLSPGSVLVFLPGYDDLVKIRDVLSESRWFTDAGQHSLFVLHSNMQSGDQRRVFRPVPAGTRKVVLSTNIAETSVTIQDIVYVIDTGKVKEVCQAAEGFNIQRMFYCVMYFISYFIFDAAIFTILYYISHLALIKGQVSSCFPA